MSKNTFSKQRPRLGFRKDLLPRPGDYFRRQGIKFSGGLEWKSAKCPFHDDKKPSLSLRLDSGGFKCHGCGAKGGDILAFHQLLTGLSFKKAAQALGAWGELL